MTTRILLTGATGFVGSAVLRRLHAIDDCEVTVLVRDLDDVPTGVAGHIIADIEDADRTLFACDGIDVVIHAAGYFGRDAELQTRVNVEGTRSLVRSAEMFEVRRIVYSSTAGVYGSGPHRGAMEGALEPSPESSLSASRLQAEGLLRDVDVSVRSNLVYGPGDRVVVPALLRLYKALGHEIEEGQARVSLVHVDDVAAIMCALALADGPLDARVVHPAPVRPERMHDVLAELRRALGSPLVEGSVTAAQARAAGQALGFSDHQIAMVSVDDWYASSVIEGLELAAPPRSFALDEQSVSWYRYFAMHPV